MDFVNNAVCRLSWNADNGTGNAGPELRDYGKRLRTVFRVRCWRIRMWGDSWFRPGSRLPLWQVWLRLVHDIMVWWDESHTHTYIISRTRYVRTSSSKISPHVFQHILSLSRPECHKMPLCFCGLLVFVVAYRELLIFVLAAWLQLVQDKRFHEIKAIQWKEYVNLTVVSWSKKCHDWMSHVAHLSQCV